MGGRLLATGVGGVGKEERRGETEGEKKHTETKKRGAALFPFCFPPRCPRLHPLLLRSGTTPHPVHARSSLPAAAGVGQRPGSRAPARG